MPYTNNAQTLADIVGGPSAAYQSGVDQGNQDYQSQMANQVAQGQMPAEIAKPGLANAFTQAQTQNEQGVAQQNQAKGQVDTATVPGQIGAANAKLSTEQMQAKAQGLSTVGQMAGQIAGMMDNVPGPARPAAMAQILQKYNIDPNSLGPLASGDPDQLRQFSQSAIKNSAAYMTSMDTERQRAASAQDVAGINQTGEIARANILANSGVQRAQIGADAKQRMASINQVIGQLTTKVANGTATQQDREALDYANRTLQMQKSGNPFAASLTGTDVQSNTPSVPQGATAPMVPGNNPQQPAVAPEQMQSAAKQLWPNDDPTKYDYRIDPNSGNLQRKAK